MLAINAKRLHPIKSHLTSNAAKRNSAMFSKSIPRPREVNSTRRDESEPNQSQSAPKTPMIMHARLHIQT